MDATLLFGFPQFWVWFHLQLFWIKIFFYQTGVSKSSGIDESSLEQREDMKESQDSCDTIWDWSDLQKEYFPPPINHQPHCCGLWYIGRIQKPSTKRLMINYKQSLKEHSYFLLSQFSWQIHISWGSEIILNFSSMKWE